MLVEIGRNERPWGPADTIRERQRIVQQLGPLPLRLDVWVRTTDRYQEAHQVVGGVEWLANTEGVGVYSRPYDRAPVVRRSPSEVRCQNVSAWMEHAVLALDEAIRNAAAGALRGGGSGMSAGTAKSASERGINALLVSHGIAADRTSGTAGMVKQLAVVDPEAAAEIQELVPEAHTPMGALKILRAVARLLVRDPVLVPYVRGPRERLSRPMLVL